jgi:histidinol phosphatase-like enzyme (inositol monophosphatase family)
MTTSEPDLDELLDFALDTAWQAGRVTLAHFQTGITAERKADNSPVTLADRQAEQKLRELITSAYPSHAILGEEFGEQPGDSPYRWILDPIDGTKSFVSGVPFYSVLVALLQGETPVLGVMHFPGLNETVYARRGGGCYWNGRRAHTSSVSTMADAVLLASDIDSFGKLGRQTAWQQLIDRTYIQRTWGDAYGYALVATGRAEIMLDPIMAVWDCGPLQIILEEAGGVFTDWDSRATIYGGSAVATNRPLHAGVMAILRGETT